MKESVVTLGTFDGVHRGHQAIIHRVVRRARALGARSVVLAFGMPPRHAGEPLRKPVLLTTLPEKLKMLRRLGVSHVDILVFDRRTASTSPEDFFLKTILRKHGAREMVAGPRVAFGKNRAGRLPLLRRLGKRYGVRIHVVSSVAGTSGAVSSRRIRAHLARGNVEKANRLLGYAYSVEGRVVPGRKRGRRLGFPTANLAVPANKILPRGVFWVKAFGSARLPISLREIREGADGLCNVGTRPTFTPRDRDLHCEVFIFKGAHRLPLCYGRKLRIAFLRRIRAEKSFSSPEALKKQIQKDFQKARGWTST